MFSPDDKPVVRADVPYFDWPSGMASTYLTLQLLSSPFATEGDAPIDARKGLSLTISRAKASGQLLEIGAS